MNDAYAIYKMASQLRNDMVNIINSGRANDNSPGINIKIYNNIRENMLKLFANYDIVKNLPVIFSPNFGHQYQSKYIEIVSATGQIMSFLAAFVRDPDEEINGLKNEIKLLQERNSKLIELHKLNSESLNKYIKAEEFPISENIWTKIPTDVSPTLHDALRAYGAGSYTASVCVCRNIIQGLVQEQCAKEGIKENGLNKQIEALILAKKIKQKHNQTLLDTVATLGHRSAHPTTEVFTKEKAALVLNGLLILIDEVFT